MVRTAGLLIFIGAVGFLNFYDDFMSNDDSEETQNRDISKQLQKKFGVKEKRSVQQLPSSRSEQPESQPLARHFEQFSEELVENYRLPLSQVASHPIDCRNAGAAKSCSCQRLLCFGGSSCSSGSLSVSASLSKQGVTINHDSGPGDNQQRQLLRCRQTTIDTYLMCECRRYTPL